MCTLSDSMPFSLSLSRWPALREILLARTSAGLWMNTPAPQMACVVSVTLFVTTEKANGEGENNCKPLITNVGVSWIRADVASTTVGKCRHGFSI